MGFRKIPVRPAHPFHARKGSELFNGFLCGGPDFEILARPGPAHEVNRQFK